MTDRISSREGDGPEHPGSAMPPATTTRLQQDEHGRGREVDGGGRDDGDKSVAELEREVEHERAELSATINDIRRSLSPGQLLDQALDYAKHSGGQQFAENLGRNVRDNPLPVLLVGAGIAWLMSSNGKAGPGRTGEAVSEAAAGMRQHASSAGSSLSQAAGKASQAATGMASSARDSLSRTWSSGSGMAASTTEATSRAGSAAREGVHDAARKAEDYAHQSGERLRHAGENAGNMWTRLAEEQPLVLGAIGLAAGAAIAAALPSTRTEDRVMGEAADATRHKIRETANRQYEQARQAVAETYEDVSEDLDKRGLSGEAVADAAASSAEKVHHAADKVAEGVEREFDPRGDQASKGSKAASPSQAPSTAPPGANQPSQPTQKKPRSDSSGGAAGGTRNK